MWRTKSHKFRLWAKMELTNRRALAPHGEARTSNEKTENIGVSPSAKRSANTDQNKPCFASTNR